MERFIKTITKWKGKETCYVESQVAAWTGKSGQNLGYYPTWNELKASFARRWNYTNEHTDPLWEIQSLISFKYDEKPKKWSILCQPLSKSEAKVGKKFKVI